MESIRSLSLVTPQAAAVIYALSALSVVAVVAALRPRWRIGWAAAGAVAVLDAAIFALNIWPKPFPDTVPWTVYACGTAAAFALFAALFAWRRGESRWRGVALVVTAVISLACAYLSTNLVYEQSPTVGSLHPRPVTQDMTLDELHASTNAPQLEGREVGALVTLPAPPMRDAIVYVPPAYFHGAELPVLVLLSGSPGNPSGWFGDGQADRALDDFQARHGGVAPIVVSADATGSTTGNPGCVNGPDYKVQTYLDTQLPELITQSFHVDQDQQDWTIGGLSYGGTCSLQVVANNPKAYGSFLDISGEPEPSLGSHEKTVNELFDGNEEAFQNVNAATLLTRAAGTDTYAGIAGRFYAGTRDEMASNALPHLNDLAQAAGMDTSYHPLPGAHSYAVWRVALRQSLDFVAQRGGIQ